MNDTNTSVVVSDSWDRICGETNNEHTNKHGIVLSSSCQSLIDTTSSTVIEEEQHQQYYSPTTTNTTQQTSSSSTIDDNGTDNDNKEYNDWKPLIRKSKINKDKKNDLSKSHKMNHGFVSTILFKQRRSNDCSTVVVPVDAKSKTSDVFIGKNKHSLKYSNVHDSDENNDTFRTTTGTGTRIHTADTFIMQKQKQTNSVPNVVKSIKKSLFHSKRKTNTDKVNKSNNSYDDTTTDVKESSNSVSNSNNNSNNNNSFHEISKTYSFDDEYILWFEDDNDINNYSYFDDDDDDDDNNNCSCCSSNIVVDAISNTGSISNTCDNASNVGLLRRRRRSNSSMNHYSSNKTNTISYNDITLCEPTISTSIATLAVHPQQQQQTQQSSSIRNRFNTIFNVKYRRTNTATTESETLLPNNTTKTTMTTTTTTSTAKTNDYFIATQNESRAKELFITRSLVELSNNKDHENLYLSPGSNFDADHDYDDHHNDNDTIKVIAPLSPVVDSSSIENHIILPTQSTKSIINVWENKRTQLSQRTQRSTTTKKNSETELPLPLLMNEKQPITNTNDRAIYSLNFVDPHVTTGTTSTFYPTVTEPVDATIATVSQEEEQEILFHLPETTNIKVDRDTTDSLEACQNNRIKTLLEMNNNNERPPPMNVASASYERQPYDNPADSTLIVSPKNKKQQQITSDKYKPHTTEPAVDQSTTFAAKKEKIDNYKMKHRKVTSTYTDECSISTRSTISNIFQRPQRRKKKTTPRTVESKRSLLSSQTNLECTITRTEKQSKRRSNNKKNLLNMSSRARIKFVDVDDAGSVVSAVSAMTTYDIRKHSSTPLLEIGRTKSNVSVDMSKPEGKKKKDASSLFGFHSPSRNSSRIKTNKTTTESLPILGAAPATYTINADVSQSLYTSVSNDTYNTLTSLAKSACAPSTSIFITRHDDDVSVSSQAKQKATNILQQKEKLDKQHIQNNGSIATTPSKLDLTKLGVEQRKQKTGLPTSLRLPKKSQSKRPILNMEDSSSSSISVVSCTTEASASSRLSILRRYTSAIGKTLQRFKQNQQRHSSININRSSSTTMSAQVDINDTDTSDGFALTYDHCEDAITFCTEGTKENNESQVSSSSNRKLLSSTNTTSSETTSKDGVSWIGSTFDFDSLDDMQDTALGSLGSFDNSNDDAIDFFNTMNDGHLSNYGSKHGVYQDDNNNNLPSANDRTVQNIINPADIECFLNIPIRQKKGRSDRCSSVEGYDESDDGSQSTCSTLTNATVFVDMDRYTMYEKPRVKIMNHTPDKVSKKQEVVITLLDVEEGDANGSKSFHDIDGGLQIRNGYLEYNLSSDSRSVSSRSRVSTGTDSRKLRQTLLKHSSKDYLYVPAVDALIKPSIVVQDDDNDDNTTTKIIDDDHITNNKVLYTIPQQLKHPVSSSNQISISILLTQSQLKIFEIVSVLVDYNTEISIVLTKARAAAIDTRLAEQTYINLCNDTSNVFTVSSSVSKLLDISSDENDKSNYSVHNINDNNNDENDCNNNNNLDKTSSVHTRFTKNEIMKKEMEKLLLVAIPYGSTAKDCQRIRRVLWRNPRLQRWWKSQQQQQQQRQQQQQQQQQQEGEI